jgi:sugar lactone lactonase YvrE
VRKSTIVSRLPSLGICAFIALFALGRQTGFAQSPAVTAQSASETVFAGQPVSFTVEANGSPAPSFKWYVSNNMGMAWIGLTDGYGFSGTDTATLAIYPAEVGMSGAEFMAVASNGVAAASTVPVTLTVEPVTQGSVLEYNFTTLAGTPPSGGSADGAGTAARFWWPVGVAVDGAGNAYVADEVNSTIRKISRAGLVTTLAGTAGNWGSADGMGSAAQFDQPSGVAVDGAGNVYVSDLGNDTIRRVTPTGSVTTIAGSAGNPGSSDGTGTAALFNYPAGLAIDALGNLYVADSNNQAVRKVVPTPVNGATEWVVSTLAGSAGQMGSANGTGSTAQFDFPYGVTVDAAGNVYVADSQNCAIRMITQGGVVTLVAGRPNLFPNPIGQGGYEDGPGSVAQFSDPSGVSVDASGNLYVADSGNGCIRKITPTVTGGVTAWMVTTLAGSGPVDGIQPLNGGSGSADGTGSAAQFNDPVGVAVANSGDIIVTDSGNNTIRTVTAAGSVGTLAGFPSRGSSDGVGSTAQFYSPMDVAVDILGNVYVVDSGNELIREITPEGVVTTLAGSPGKAGNADGTGSAALFNSPEGVAVDSSGNVYVADTSNATIRELTPTASNGSTVWTVTTLAGSVGLEDNTDGTGSAARFDMPTGLAMDVSGNLYVADYGAGLIRKITPTETNGITAWVVTTLAGGPYSSLGDADGTGSAARFNQPHRVAVDATGNVYVADVPNIRKVTPAGVVTTLAEVPGGNAQGLAVDILGNLYMTTDDTFGTDDTISKMTPTGAVTTIAGGNDIAAGSSDSSDGTGGAAHFYLPGGIAIDGAGRLFVADTNNNTIREGVLTLQAAGATEPMSQTVNAGSTVVLSIVATGATSFQWQLNGVNLDGQTPNDSGYDRDQLVITNAGAANAGTYTCVVTINGISATSAPAALAVVSGQSPGMVTTFSARAFVGTGDNILIGGFYITGSTSVTVLVQAIGPALAGAPFNVTGTLQKPELTIHQNQNGKDVVLYSNTGWGSNPALLAAAAAAYAQPVLTPGSADSEVLLTLPPGGYTAEVTGADGGTGVALCAIYQLQ